MRRMFDTTMKDKELHQVVRLNKVFRSDLHWWHLHVFQKKWNGVGFLAPLNLGSPSIIIQTDASGHWGCGACWSNNWFQAAWSDTWTDTQIMIKELVPIVLACVVWGKPLARQWVSVQCDNMAVVPAISKGSAKEPTVMHLLRCLWFFTAYYDIKLTVQHIPGVENVAADHLSRNNLPQFFSISPQAKRVPTPIPQELIDLVTAVAPDWTSMTFKKPFSTITKKV